MIKIVHKGNFKNTERFLEKNKKLEISNILKIYGQLGVEALSANTPVESGETANSWSYEISQDRDGWRIYWCNSHVNDGIPIAILIQYGHGTGTGGYVEGRDFINPALRPVFDELADKAWKEVTQ